MPSSTEGLLELLDGHLVLLGESGNRPGERFVIDLHAPAARLLQLDVLQHQAFHQLADQHVVRGRLDVVPGDLLAHHIQAAEQLRGEHHVVIGRWRRWRPAPDTGPAPRWRRPGANPAHKPRRRPRLNLLPISMCRILSVCSRPLPASPPLGQRIGGWIGSRECCVRAPNPLAHRRRRAP